MWHTHTPHTHTHTHHTHMPLPAQKQPDPLTVSTILKQCDWLKFVEKPDDSLPLQSCVILIPSYSSAHSHSLPLTSLLSLWQRSHPVPAIFLPILPQWSLCPLYWPLSCRVALDPSARGCYPWIPVSVCVCTVPAERQPSLPLAMPFYSSAEPAQAALHSGWEGGRTGEGREGGREGRRGRGWMTGRWNKKQQEKRRGAGVEGFVSGHWVINVHMSVSQQLPF